MVLLDSCHVHLHHRTKLVLRCLKAHTMAHFRIANLSRLDAVRQDLIANTEKLASTIDRSTTPAPPNVHLLHTVADILFDFNAPHHQRKRKKDIPIGNTWK